MRKNGHNTLIIASQPVSRPECDPCVGVTFPPAALIS